MIWWFNSWVKRADGAEFSMAPSETVTSVTSQEDLPILHLRFPVNASNTSTPVARIAYAANRAVIWSEELLGICEGGIAWEDL